MLLIVFVDILNRKSAPSLRSVIFLRMVLEHVQLQTFFPYFIERIFF